MKKITTPLVTLLLCIISIPCIYADTTIAVQSDFIKHFDSNIEFELRGAIKKATNSQLHIFYDKVSELYVSIVIKKKGTQKDIATIKYLEHNISTYIVQQEQEILKNLLIKRNLIVSKINPFGGKNTYFLSDTIKDKEAKCGGGSFGSTFCYIFVGDDEGKLQYIGRYGKGNGGNITKEKEISYIDKNTIEFKISGGDGGGGFEGTLTLNINTGEVIESGITSNPNGEFPYEKEYILTK